jgi:hypothetical protein
MAPHILNLGTRWKGPAVRPRRFIPGEIPRYSLDRRRQSRSGHGVEEKKSLPLQGIEFLSSIPHLVTILIDLPYMYVYHMHVSQYLDKYA